MSPSSVRAAYVALRSGLTALLPGPDLLVNTALGDPPQSSVGTFRSSASSYRCPVFALGAGRGILIGTLVPGRDNSQRRRWDSDFHGSVVLRIPTGNRFPSG